MDHLDILIECLATIEEDPEFAFFEAMDIALQHIENGELQDMSIQIYERYKAHVIGSNPIS